VVQGVPMARPRAGSPRSDVRWWRGWKRRRSSWTSLTPRKTPSWTSSRSPPAPSSARTPVRCRTHSQRTTRHDQRHTT
jgi:hypothetical protein